MPRPPEQLTHLGIPGRHPLLQMPPPHGTVGVDEERSKLLTGRRPQHSADQLDGEVPSPPPPEDQNQRHKGDSGLGVGNGNGVGVGVGVGNLTEQLPRPLPHFPNPVTAPDDHQRRQLRTPDGLLERGLPNPPVVMTQRDRKLRLGELLRRPA
ncbi:hypothetical protein [Streptomyces sp. NPDC101455]|uniref:hypothetical protein n=1 Tax=Streptomyces sp. NPDC101455 TaxID=3366142 RepID=UPI00381C9B94